MKNDPLPRLDQNPELHRELVQQCRLQRGEVWQDDEAGHRVGCLDAASSDDVEKLMDHAQADLFINDPPYNLVAFDERSVPEFIDWCHNWVKNSICAMAANSSLYIWIGADQNDGFQPLPEFMTMMRDFPVQSRSFITVRNQRGYGTQKNWMAVRQELLYYAKGTPHFKVIYTDIPKILKGYYKEVSGKVTENIERSKSDCIRPGNVWVDIQQVFYRMKENVSGCYAQKPLRAIERIVEASSQRGQLLADLFSHSGTTLIAAEKSGRRCFTMDIDPVFCEMTIKRLERFRRTGQEGWQNDNPFSEQPVEASLF